MRTPIRTIPLQAVLDDVYAIIKHDHLVDEDDLLLFASQEMESLRIKNNMQRALCFIRVSNYRAKMPRGLYFIESVLYNKNPIPAEQDPCMHKVITSDCCNGTNYALTGKCIDDYFSCNTCSNGNKWMPLHYNDNIHHRGLLMKCSLNTTCQGHGCGDSFSLDIESASMFFTFESGWIALAYLRAPMSDKGEFLIPDAPEVKAAISSWVKKCVWEIRMNNLEQGAERMYERYKQEYHLWHMQAVGEQLMPQIEEYVELYELNRFVANTSPFAFTLGNLGNERLHF
jgi:hypothetical protein